MVFRVRKRCRIVELEKTVSCHQRTCVNGLVHDKKNSLKFYRNSKKTHMENSCPTPRSQIYSKLLKMDEKLIFRFQIFVYNMFECFMGKYFPLLIFFGKYNSDKTYVYCLLCIFSLDSFSLSDFMLEIESSKRIYGFFAS